MQMQTNGVRLDISKSHAFKHPRKAFLKCVLGQGSLMPRTGYRLPQGVVRQIEFDFLEQIVRVQIYANFGADLIVSFQPLHIIRKLETARAVDLEMPGLELLTRLWRANAVDQPSGRGEQITRIPGR